MCFHVKPNPDKPELNIADCRLKIYGIASLCLLYYNRSFNFYPIFISLFESKVSDVSVQDLRLRLSSLTPET